MSIRLDKTIFLLLILSSTNRKMMQEIPQAIVKSQELLHEQVMQFEYQKKFA